MSNENQVLVTALVDIEHDREKPCVHFPVDKADGEDKPTSRLSWVGGWVLVPGTVIGVIFGGGALVGAHFHDSWFTRAIGWVVELFV